MTRRLLRRALQLAEKGWYVFPLRPNDKRPLPRFTKWEERATRDQAQIIRWWRSAPYNIGIATGPSGLLVIDCDTAGGAEHAQWRLVGDVVELTGHRLPRTFSVRTPNGGLHLYFNAPDQLLGNTAGKLGRRIDTRGAGGYVVGPGSVCRGRYYTIMDCAPVEGLPEWIIDKLLPAPIPTLRPSVQRYQDHYLRAIIYGEAQRVRTAPPGSRNNALNVAAFILGQLVGGAELSESEARTILWQAVRLHLGVDAFNTTEAERTITSGLAAGALRPRSVSERS
jgi:hypothetical protein